jgi:hypothetical protein
MKRSFLTTLILAGTLMAGAAQAEVVTQPPAPAVAQVSQAAQGQTSQGYDNWNGVPVYLLRKGGTTLINGLLPTNPDAQG